MRVGEPFVLKNCVVSQSSPYDIYEKAPKGLQKIVMVHIFAS